jgi:hypothetical protein
MTLPLISDPKDRLLDFDEVLKNELQLIRERLKHLQGVDGESVPQSSAPESAAPFPNSRSGAKPRQTALEMDLAGLAFSGGGIRSATFNLGVLQALAHLDLLSKFDYLSTVSGGGYIGGWLAAWIKREGDPLAVEQQLKPNRQKEAAARRLLEKGLIVEDEPEPVHHLRSYSNYLSPRLGLLEIDTWTLISIYLRNLLLNLTVLVPLMLALVLLCRLLLCAFFAAQVPFPVVFAAGAGSFGLLLFGLASLGSDLRERFKQLRKPGGDGVLGSASDSPEAGGRLRRLLFHGVQTKREEVARRMHLLVFLPLLVGSALLSWLFRCDDPGFFLGDTLGNGLWLIGTGCALIGFVFGAVRWFVGVRVVRQAAPHTRPVTKQHRHDWSTTLYSAISGFLVGGLLLVLVHWLEFGTLTAGQRASLVLTLGPPLVLLLACLAIATEVGLHGRLLEEDAREWWGTVAGYLLIYACCWLAIFSLAIYSSWLVEQIDGWVQTGLAASWLTMAISGALSGRSASTFNGQGSRWRECLGVVAPPVFVVGLLVMVALLAGLIVGGGEGSYWNRLSDSDPIVCLLALLGSVGLAYLLSAHVDVNLFSMHGTYANRLIRCYLGASRRKVQWRRRDADDPQSGSVEMLPREGSSQVRATLDAPIRNWLPGRGGAPTGNDEDRERQDDLLTGFDPDDDILLSDLAIGKQQAGDHKTYWGPFLIVNTAINLVAGEELAWQERKADSFVLTPLCGGSKSTGYRWLPQFQPNVSEPCNLTLGRALAISGAAASPNMGYHTSTPLRFLMTVFNVRLGWWMENPHWADWGARGAVQRDLLLHELLGQANETGRFVYLSDGGHFENLGVYELVRRRCRFIVACDAGADPDLNFFDLGGLIRKCRTDFGIRVEIDVAPIRRQVASGRSQWHCAVGTIYYGDVDRNAVPGMLIYLKASLTGDEPSDVLAYADEHDSFPHQSTANQFFTESQFESYRALGFHIAREVFGDALTDTAGKANGRQAGRTSDSTKKRLFSRLRQRWFPPLQDLESQFLETTKEFAAVQQHLRRDMRLRGLSEDLYPELKDFSAKEEVPPQDAHLRSAGDLTKPETAGEDRERDRAELHAVSEMLQVMENTWLRLKFRRYYEHPLNRGWMTVFRRWTNSEAFSKYWPCLRGEFSPDFVQFCERELKLVLWDIRADRIRRGEEALPDNVEALKQLDKEFAFEWYAEDAAGRGIQQLVKRAADLARQVDCDPFIWVIRVTNASKEEDSELGAGNVDRPIGVILLFEPSGQGLPEGGGGYEFFVWLLGPYRNQGIGRDPDCVQPALNEAWSELARSRSGRPFSLFVRYPREAQEDGEEPVERALWSSFFHYYDFYEVGSEELGETSDIILACDSVQRERRRAQATPAPRSRRSSRTRLK